MSDEEKRFRAMAAANLFMEGWLSRHPEISGQDYLWILAMGLLPDKEADGSAGSSDPANWGDWNQAIANWKELNPENAEIDYVGVLLQLLANLGAEFGPNYVLEMKPLVNWIVTYRKEAEGNWYDCMQLALADEYLTLA